ncbi:hypothetical protein N7537_002831 [Penicillium hordei]|uniref:Ketoreductase domain-containing protein n=1 Tax=Penicillium hordei TaxID=40994 RepID=A0AAD6H8Z9_9EURO|nr:uncharacterized protein N7537_002831 [Penicillium hordei]KAJ5617717.1 hypothetical protein N7537_002831 [Penicillium hordei]
MRVQDRTFIISGGSSGLGLATTTGLVHNGAYVAVFDLTEPAKAIVEKLPPNRVKFYPVDIASTTSVADAVQDTVKWSNETHAPLGGTVCCAGVLAPGMIINSSFEPLALSTIQNAININLVGTLNLIRLVVSQLAQLPESIDPGNEYERGVVVMVSSAAAYDGQPGQVAYSATKGAIRSLTLPLARDLSRYGIRAVSIAPSLFSTAMTAKGKLPEKARQTIERNFEWPKRAGKPDEFSEFVLEICRNRMLNGCCLRLDGAMRLPSKL